jgi:phosphomethylpyrimidine synthase
MQISQEVRAFASKQNQGVEGFLATASKAAARKGMEEKIRVFKDSRSELYLGGGGREHD